MNSISFTINDCNKIEDFIQYFNKVEDVLKSMEVGLCNWINFIFNYIFLILKNVSYVFFQEYFIIIFNECYIKFNFF